MSLDWSDISDFGGSIAGGISDFVSSPFVQSAANLGSAFYDIYSGLQDQARADKMYDIMYGSATQQDAWAKEMSDRTKKVYWPLEDLNIQYTKEDIAAMRPTAVAQRDYNVLRTGQQIDQAKAINPMLDTTERNMLTKLTEGPEALGLRLANQGVTGVNQAFANQQGIDLRKMQQQGLNPSSGAMLNYNRSMGQAQALANANARNQAYSTAEDTALNRQAQAVNYRAGIPLSTYNATPSFNAGSVSGALGSNTSTALSAANTANQNAQNAFTGAATSLNNLYYQPYQQAMMQKLLA